MVLAKKLLALNVKTLRKKYSLSQEKLAEATGLSVQSISDIEGCRTWVSDKTLEKLAIALKVDIFLLFMPLNESNGNALETFMYDRLMELRTALKKDIDNRLDQFYIHELRINTKT
ncbi:MAG: helix-turn-helix domain-containing protein [Treponema sp.]|nr:helix-turn-helix domain-containing protein [Treponema sp.]